MIEKYSSQIDYLKRIGCLFYEQKIAVSFKEKPISKLNIRYGVSIPAPKRKAGKYPLYASNGIVDFINETNAKSAIIFGCRGSIGNVMFSKQPCFVLNTAFYTENNDDYGNILFALIYEKGLSLYATGAAQPQITLSAISDVSLKIPQDHDLNILTDRIVVLEEKINKLKSIKALLLSKYFG